MQLRERDFQAIADGQEVELQSWKSPEESVPPPAWIVVLLDFSGSMKRKDSSGTTKLQGAIDATRRFIEETANRGGNTRVAILPFGDSGKNCAGYEVTQESIETKFFPANDIKQQNLLDYLANKSPCASTNIYDPLEEAIRLLGDEEDPRFYVPEDSNKPQPRLSVILLSDGYHNKPNEERDFNNLLDLLDRHDNIVVHTLGYGLTPEQLGRKYNLGRAATRDDVQTANNNNKPVPPDEFVDQSRLEQIAEATGGISEFSGNADDIVDALQLFLNALLGEYELIYQERNPERGSKHEVLVRANINGTEIQTQTKPYTIAVFGRSPSVKSRLIMTGLIAVVLGIGGVLPFWKWSQALKQKAEEDS